jgi:hypothetical protein
MGDHDTTKVQCQPTSEHVFGKNYGDHVPYDDFVDTRTGEPFLVRTPYERREAHRALLPGEDGDRFILEQ